MDVTPSVTSPTPQHFCLRWNNYQTNLTAVFDQMLQTESFVDVTIACHGHSLKAHKMILSACSPYFKAILHENPCKHPVLIMSEYKWPELKAVVEFMYKGEINVAQEQIGPLLKVAESLRIRGLADVTGDLEANEIRHPDDDKEREGEDAKEIKVEPVQVWDSIHVLNNNKYDVDEDGRGRKRRRISDLRTLTRDCKDSRQNEDAPDERTDEDAIHRPNQSPIACSPSQRRSATPRPPSVSSTPATRSPTLLEDLPASPVSSPVCLTSNRLAQVAATAPAVPGLALHLAGNVTPAGLEEMEIKPGIAEMIREEERAKLLETSQAWLGASTSSISADSYQYQLQSMWQKCWSTNQSLVHNLRFRERGPLKSWRPETMAEAIFSVLKEGLSLSQAARKFDIPYPTFVLYANRVHNMLGPSSDGGTDLRPKGRGRPQRILLGVWPDDHIRGVIRSVVFRDSQQQIKEEPSLSSGYHRLHDGLSIHPYTPLSCATSNGQLPPDAEALSESNTAAAVASAVVAQNLRQHMYSMVAAAQHHTDLINLMSQMSPQTAPPERATDRPDERGHVAHDLSVSPFKLDHREARIDSPNRDGVEKSPKRSSPHTDHSTRSILEHSPKSHREESNNLRKQSMTSGNDENQYPHDLRMGADQFCPGDDSNLALNLSGSDGGKLRLGRTDVEDRHPSEDYTHLSSMTEANEKMAIKLASPIKLTSD